MSKNIDFKKLVSDMRKAQKLYFKSRDRRDLQKAKEVEKEVDEFLNRYFREENQVNGLFDQ